MPQFRYKAYNSSGAIAIGEIAAASRQGALDSLARRGQMAFEILEASASASNQPWWQRDIFSRQRLGARNLALLTRELSSLVKADIPIDEALRIVSVQPMLPQRLRLITTRCLERVMQGEALSDALDQEGGMFPAYYIRLVKAGEASGALGDVLSDLAHVVERGAEARARLHSALLYPAVLLLAAIAALVVILTILIPAILPMFEDAGAAPPALIRLLSSMQAFTSDHWLTLAILALAIGIGLSLSVQSPTVGHQLDKILLRLPLLGTLIQQRETARLARTLSVLLGNGVPLLDALQISSGVLSNRCFANALKSVVMDVKEGSTLHQPLTRSGLFPDLFLRLTAVGEKTAQLDAMQMRVAQIYESAVERQVERLTSLITPVLTLVIGGCVGGLIISVMSAIFSVNDLALK